MKFAIFLKRILPVFCLENKALQLNILKTRTAMNAKFSGFICVEAIMYLLLHNLQDCVHSIFFRRRSCRSRTVNSGWQSSRARGQAAAENGRGYFTVRPCGHVLSNVHDGCKGQFEFSQRHEQQYFY